MSSQLLDFSKYENSNSKFTAELSSKGGNITFSNSGKGGNKKYFTLGLDSFLNILNDIKNNISEFKGHEKYVEKEWRDLGSKYYKDKPANAQCTVQTKPMFSTLSKIIIWANSPSLDSLNPEQEINLEIVYLENAIVKLSELSDKFTPVQNTLYKSKRFEIKSNSIREFALSVFKHFYNKSWDKLIEDSTIKDSKINETKYEILDYKSFNNLIGVFDSPQDKSSLSSSNTIRYFENPIHNEDGKTYYFTTQWNATGEYNLSFLNLQKFIETEYPKYKVVQENKTFKLLIKSNPFSIENFYSDCINSNLKYSNQLITRYVSSLATKPFVLLSGLSGSGKTKLAQSFAQWICEDENQYCIVPVGADWTNREPLLGYVNALETDKYILPENGALQLIIEANKEENQNKPYFLILDEMNLSHVERYFADFLSVMESKDKFKLHSDKEQEKSGVPFELSWPKNLFVVGTVNIDETTYMFSPKVLDRANAIEFRVTEKEISSFLKSPSQIDLTQLESKGANMAASFIKTVKNNIFEEIDTDDLNDTLVNFFSQLQKTGAEFGYRTGMEIHRLYQQLTVINEDISENEKIDIAVMQKLLPKLHGSRRKLCPILEILGNICVKDIDVKKDIFENEDFNLYQEVDGELVLTEGVLYPLSLEKITRMYNGAIDNGFASYAEA